MMIEKDWLDRPFENFMELADAIGETLECPVTIENANHQLIAYSSHHATTDPVRTATIISRQVPEHVTGALWKSGVLRMLMESDSPVKVKAIADMGLGERTVISIRHHGDVLGYIWVLEEGRPLDAKGTALLVKAAGIAKQLMLQLQMHKHKEDEGRHNFFWQLLTGQGQTDEWIRGKAASLHMQLPERFQIVLFQADTDMALNVIRQMQYLMSAAENTQIVVQVRDGRQFILLVSPSAFSRSDSSGSTLIGYVTRHMLERFGTVLEGAAGLAYDSYTLVAQSYKEAQQLLELKRRFPRELRLVRDYHSLGYYRYLPLIHTQQRSPFETGVIAKLRNYDREHNNCLLDTLKAFLELDSNIKDTADALQIHPNTLNYRLKRISEIGDIDLKNMDHKVTVYLELKLEHL
ncbi:PucR family transcriptional regulator [Paenibacillus thalictri]|uniref:PucR family transcriptional regulator n=1 Tax=Paenibacillus thalictri TaxID=2527873 RepID=A0A4Q9DTG9_9BACL|nr:helix-turn-helix domain-containing protein [Paenibacillus thalictri]TBL79435.1 PucR family transcriptional regulator [Paenibacillus thalictri]